MSVAKRDGKFFAPWLPWCLLRSSFIPIVILIALPFAALAANGLSKPVTDFTKAEKGEKFPGGAGSHSKTLNRNAFLQPSANMRFERRLDFSVGQGFFKRLWVSAPASTQAADGLGPLYNARACSRCHIRNGRGQPPEGSGTRGRSLILRLSIPPQNDAHRRLLDQRRISVVPEPTYGHQFQDIAIQGHAAEGQLKIEYKETTVELADGDVVKLRQPQYSVSEPAYGVLHDETLYSPRIAPQMIGLGLLEAIDEAAILAQADPDDRDGDGISGKANEVWSHEYQRVMLGRFGWKAGSPTLNEQSQSAFVGDMGISTPLHPHGAGDCTTRQTACLQALHGNSPQFENLEAPAEVVDAVVFYVRNLAVPVRRNADSPEVLAGKKLFYESGCIACHTPKYMTRTLDKHAEQSSQLIWPYTDMLLHDMGEGLADGRPEGLADGREWRTPPLWGVGLIPVVNGHRYYLHDGRARNLLEAVLWHGGEAEASRLAVVKMPRSQREQLIRFLESL